MTRSRRTKPFASLIAAALMVCTACGALAQLQTWSPEARSKSQALVSASVSLLLKRQWDPAIQSLTRATVADGSDPIAFEMLGLALGAQHRLNEALDNLQHAYSLEKSPEVLLSTGIVYYLDHDYQAALNSYSRALELKSNWIDIAGNIGYAYYRQGDLPRAEENFRALIKAHPNWQFGYQGLATVQYLRGQFSAARGNAMHAETLRSYAPTVLLLAKLDMLEGDLSGGTKRVSLYRSKLKKNFAWRPMTELGFPLQRDFKWDPYIADNYDSGTLLLARASGGDAKKRDWLAKQGGAGSMIATISDALRESPNDVMLLRDLGLAQLAAGANEDAAKSFSQVLRLSPSCTVDRLHLARALAGMGKDQEAAEQVAAFQRAAPREKLSPAFTSLLQPKGTSGSGSGGGTKDSGSGF